MLELALAIVVLGAMALAGFKMYLDRLHPVIKPVDPTADLIAQVKRLQEEVQEMKIGRSLRNGGRQTEEDV